MTDNEKREKVIKGLECCMSDGSECYEPSIGKCPYYKDDVTESACTDDLFYDVYALLKAQEPRVMTLEEIGERTPMPCWIEWDFNEMWPVIVRGVGSVIDYIGFNHSLCFMKEDYCKKVRCWTSCPDQETREATPWE